MTGMHGTDSGSVVGCSIVDVFAERPLSGNQLAVVRGCSHLDTATMQAIALETNFSETTFVVEEFSDEARVRIFPPTRELPFAGHPTLGTAWVLGRDRDSYTLDLPAGRVRVTFEAGGIAWMQPPPVEPGDVLSPQSAAALLGLSPADIDNRYPCRFATIGPWFVRADGRGTPPPARSGRWPPPGSAARSRRWRSRPRSPAPGTSLPSRSTATTRRRNFPP